MIWLLFAFGSAFFAGITAVLAQKSESKRLILRWRQRCARLWFWHFPG